MIIGYVDINNVDRRVVGGHPVGELFDDLVVHSLFARKNHIELLVTVLKAFRMHFNASVSVEHVEDAVLSVPEVDGRAEKKSGRRLASLCWKKQKMRSTWSSQSDLSIDPIAVRASWVSRQADDKSKHQAARRKPLKKRGNEIYSVLSLFKRSLYILSYGVPKSYTFGSNWLGPGSLTWIWVWIESEGRELKQDKIT